MDEILGTHSPLRGLSNNGTASGGRGLKTAGLPPLAVRMQSPGGNDGPTWYLASRRYERDGIPGTRNDNGHRTDVPVAVSPRVPEYRGSRFWLPCQAVHDHGEPGPPVS